MDPQTLKHQILERGVRSLLDEAKVPMRIHMQVLKVLGKRIKAHDEANKAHEGVLKEHKERDEQMKDTLTRHGAHMEAHEAQIGEWDGRVNEFMSRDWTGAQGEIGPSGADGIDGETPDLDQLVQAVLERIPVPKDGKDGKDAEIKEDKIVTKVVKYIKDKQSLDLSHIKGAQKFIKDGVSYKVEELMHGGSSSSGSSNFVFNEIVSGSGTSWTLANTPIIGSVVLWGEGQALTPGVGNDYTISGKNITTANSFSAGALLAMYQT